MKKLLFIFGCMLALFVNAQAANYTINDSQLDEQFSQAVATEMVNMEATTAEIPGMGQTIAPAGEKNAIIAVVLAFFLGGLGIHRFYLGTEVMTGIGYILTCGGIFGLIPFIDFIVLIINMNDVSAYVDNPKFFMW